MSARHLLAALAVSAATLTQPAAAQSLRFADLYQGFSLDFSEAAQSLDGQTVEMAGFMAPPLKADADFFVLTVVPMAACPFCDDAMDWPRDIVMVEVGEDFRELSFDRPILVTGTLELGTAIDDETGFVSRVRLVDAEFEVTTRDRLGARENLF